MIPRDNPRRPVTEAGVKLAITVTGGVKVMTIVAMYWNEYVALSEEHARPVCQVEV